MADESKKLPVGQQVPLPGHFDVPVVLEAARPLGKGYECRVRLPDGMLDETVISDEEAAALAGASPAVEVKTPLVNAEQLRLLIESARIRLAYTHDPHFAVSLSGIRTLPHQIEAVYLKMTPLRTALRMSMSILLPVVRLPDARRNGISFSAGSLCAMT